MNRVCTNKVVSDSVLSDSIGEKTTSGGVNVSSDMTVAAGKSITSPSIYVDDIYESTALNDIRMRDNVKLDGILKTDYIQKNAGGYIQLNSSMVQSTGFIAAHNITTDQLNENTAAQGVLATANLNIAAGKVLSVDTIASKSGGAINFNNVINAATITPAGGVLSINADTTLGSGKSLSADTTYTDTTYTDTINQKGSSGITLGHAVKMNSVSSGTSNKVLIWDSSTKSVGYTLPATLNSYGNVWFEDFSSAAIGNWSGTEAHVSCDFPWLVRSDNVGLVYLGLDENGQYQQAGEYLQGAIYPYINSSSNADHYWGFNNFTSFFLEKNDITYEAKIRMPFVWSSGYFDSLKVFIGMGGLGFDGNSPIDCSRFVGLYYNSAVDNQKWNFTVNTDGSASVPIQTADFMTTAVLRFKMIIRSATGNVEFYLNNGTFGAMALNYTATGLSWPSQQKFQPRFGMRLNSSLSAGATKLGIILDYIRISQDYNRF